MLQANPLETDINQIISFYTEEGELFTLNFKYFTPLMQWSIDITTPNTSINGIRIVPNINILRQYFNKVSFGLVFIYDKELLYQDDLAKTTMYIINKAEASDNIFSLLNYRP